MESRARELQPQLNDTNTVPANQTAKGETWYFTVKPKDGTDFGELKISPNVIIQNSPPSISSVEITPDPAYENDTLTTTPIGWFDADGDPENYTYQWQKYQDGQWQDIPGATSPTLDPQYFTAGDEIKASCTPNDNQDYGTPKDYTIIISSS